jgi:hypothetical protein
VERVRVHDRGEIDVLEQLPDERTPSFAATEPRPESEGAGALAGIDDRPQRCPVLPADLYRLEREGLDDGQGRRRYRQRDVARVGAERRPGGESSRAAHPRLAADDENGSRRVLRVALEPARDQRQHLGGGAARVGRDVL